MKKEARHWSQPPEHPEQMIIFTVRCPEFGKVTARCECGWATEATTMAYTNAQGRPAKPVTAMQTAYEEMLQHAKQHDPLRAPFVRLIAAGGAQTELTPLHAPEGKAKP